MYAVVLSAGIGTRLGASIPKPLVDIGDGRTLLGNQIRLLAECFGLERMRLVVGYEAQAIEAAFPDIICLLNPRFAETNTARSLAIALDRLPDDDVLWTNGDVYFEQPVLDQLLSTHAESSRILVNSARTGEEEVKYDLAEDGSVRELSKHVPSPRGESMGVQIVIQRDLPALKRALELTTDQDYFEKAIELAIQSNCMCVMPVSIGDAFCCEVDTPDDLVRVREYVRAGGAP